MSLALWLRAGRAQKGLTLDQVAKITKIQPRILERLEAGKLDGLPAEVFVRGFVRSVAKCVGLDETEALARYAAAQGVPTQIPTARAFVEQMSGLAPETATSILAPVVLVSNPLSTTLSAISAPASSLTDLATVDVAIEIDTTDDVEVRADSVEPAAVLVEAAPIASVAVEAVDHVGAPAEIATAIEVVETPVAVVHAHGSKKSKKRKARGSNAPKNKQQQRAKLATGTPSAPTPIVASEPVVEAVVASEPVVETALETAVVEAPVAEASVASVFEASVEAPVETAADALFGASTVVDTRDLEAESAAPAIEVVDATEVGGTWAPKMPTVATSSVPWRRPAMGIYATRATTAAPAIPTLVIDDADPDLAEREQEDRNASAPTRKSFLPPILAERAKHAASGQGTLTLAVIILLIAATLTLSYLMRRPSSSGDGVTRADGTVELVG